MPEPPLANQGLWLLRYEPRAHARISWHLLRSGKPDVLNEDEVDNAERTARIASGVVTFSGNPLPVEVPPLQLAMPDTGAPPDYFGVGGWEFCSRRFREALAQPEYVVQFAPVDLIGGNARARAQEYRRMRVLACEPVMDMERSEYQPVGDMLPTPGLSAPQALYVWRYALLENLQPRTGIFRIDRTSGDLMVTDAVARQMLRAGCTGVEFRDPTVHTSTDMCRIRTVTGVVEVWN
jgi:hypothetical protein